MKTQNLVTYIFIMVSLISSLIIMKTGAFWIVIIIIPLYFIAWSLGLTHEQRKQDAENNQKLQKLQERIDNLKKNITVPANPKTMERIAKNDKELTGVYYIWKDNDYLCLVVKDVTNPQVDPERINLDKISIASIEYYFNTGELYSETKIEGSGGGGSSLSGAVVGGLLAGGIGAIIGSRKPIDPITSQLITHDTRETVLKYTIAGEAKFIYFKKDESKVLFDLIPEKSFETVQAIKVSEMKSDNQMEDNVYECIRQLSKLKDEGILTENDFQSKKVQLLNRI